MKIKLTLITENNVPVETLGDEPEEKIKLSWELVLSMIATLSDDESKAQVESVEILG